MRYGSVCSGIEAATVAWYPLGWQPQWFSEIEPFPSAVIKHHYPMISNLGDMTKLYEKKEFRDRAIDLLAGGTPCQSFSVAGLRKGLADPRGNLALHYLGDWRRAAAVLFEHHSLSGNPPPSREAGKRVAASLAQSTKSSGGIGMSNQELFSQGGGNLVSSSDYIPFRPSSYGKYTEGIGTLMAGGGGGCGQGGDETLLIHHALRREGHDVSEDGTGRGTPIIAFDCKAGGNTAFSIGEKPGSLRGDGHGGGHAAIAFEPGSIARHAGPRGEHETVSTLRAAMGDNQPAVMSGMMVRRLTPRECERLQGFPDDYTLIKYRGKMSSDGPRYKALGNSMAVPVMRWIGKRIIMVENALAKT